MRRQIVYIRDHIAAIRRLMVSIRDHIAAMRRLIATIEDEIAEDWTVYGIFGENKQKGLDIAGKNLA
jgi:hypothetical protein